MFQMPTKTLFSPIIRSISRNVHIDIEEQAFIDTSTKPYPASGVLVVNTKKKNRASLSISKETKGLLDSIKHTGQSYNGLIQELVWLWKKEHRLAESGQPVQRQP